MTLKQRPFPKKEDGFIYIVQAQQWHKIGRTWSLSKRLAQLSILPPFPTSMIHAFGCDNVRAAEEDLHQQFAGQRVTGEWFLLDDVDLAVLLDVCLFSSGLFHQGDQKYNQAVFLEGCKAGEGNHLEGMLTSNPFDPAYPCYGVWQRGYNGYIDYIERGVG